MGARMISLEPGLPDRGVWSQLAEASTNVFLTPEWIETWREHFAADRTPVTVSGEEWLAVLVPGQTVPLRALRFAGHGLADELGPICAPADRARAAVALLDSLRDRRACDVLLWEQLASDADWAALPGTSEVDRIASPIIRLEHSDWDTFLADKTGSFRTQLRRDRKSADAAGPWNIELVREPDRVDEALEALFAMHRERFGSDSGFLAGGAVPFHRRFAQIAFARGWLRLWVLEVRGAIEAVWYGFRFADSDAHYQSGRSSTCPAGGGNLLVASAVRSALEDGLREYRFLRGGESYKLRWANGGADLQTLVSGVTRSGRGAAAVAGGVHSAGIGRLAGRATRRLMLAR
jgi:CelD/BcsL family acetyltransferase involved in cellulose biosynthesis